MLYYYSEKEVKRFQEDMSFFSNAAGDFHYNGKDLKEEDLPEALKRAFNELWSENTGSYCYLCQFKGKYSIALCNEFSTADDEWEDMKKSQFKENVLRNGGKIAELGAGNADVIVREEKTPFSDMEVYVVMDAYVAAAYFNIVADTLYEFIYTTEDVPFSLVIKEEEKDLASMICELKDGEILELCERDSDNEITYCAERIKWKDSCLALIGGYGGDTKCCYLSGASVIPDSSCNQEDMDTIRQMVHEFCQLVHAKESDFVVKKEMQDGKPVDFDASQQARMDERLDELDNATFDVCQSFVENEDDLEWSMSYIGEVNDYIVRLLVAHGHQVYYPFVIETGNHQQVVYNCELSEEEKMQIKKRMEQYVSEDNCEFDENILDTVQCLCKTFTQNQELVLSKTVLTAIAKCINEQLSEEGYETIFS